MQQALRSSVTASIALVGAGLIAVTPTATPSSPDVKMPAVQLTGFGDLSGEGLGLAAAASPGESIQQMLIDAIQQSETNFADSFQSGAQALGTQLGDFGTQLDAMGANLTAMGGAIDPILGAIYTDLGTFYGPDDLGGLVQLSGTIIPFLAQPLYDIEIQEVNLGAALFDLLTGTATGAGAAADIAPDMATGVSSLVADLSAIF